MSIAEVALVQFDTIPEQIDCNHEKMKSLVEEAADSNAWWIVFHEATVCGYTSERDKYAEPIPTGKSTCYMSDLASRHNCYISFGLSETENERYFISQVFVGPHEYWYRYRKTWLANNGTLADQVTPNDQGYRHEWVRYDPGTGPELFTLDGVKATCFLCADGEAPRCIERARMLAPQVVFYPNNRSRLPNVMDPGVGRPFDVLSQRAREINAPMLVTNRTGRS